MTVKYEDFSLTNGTYYYVIVAENSEVASDISNCESVVVEIPATTPTGQPSDTTEKTSFPMGLILISLSLGVMLVTRRRKHLTP